MRKKKPKEREEWSVPQLESLILWAFMEASAGGKVKLEVEFDKVKTLLLDRKELPHVESVCIPKISSESVDTMDKLDILLE